MTASTTVPAKVNAANVQGNLVGFNKDHLRLLYLNFPAPQAGRALLGAVAATEISNAHDVLAINKIIKRIEGEQHANRDTIQTSGVNVVLSFAGLAAIEAPELTSFPPEFQQGMAARASILGDVDGSAPATWVSPFTGGAQVHAMLIIAADQPEVIESRTSVLRSMIAAAGATELGFQDGNNRPGAGAGREHFGFKDGISQPSIVGLTASSKGGPEIAAGEFLIGYPDQDGNVSGSGAAPVPPALGQPGYNPAPPSPAPLIPLPAWAHDGSFVVFRRLRQDVAAFNAFMQQQAAAAGMQPEQLAAKLVGRWPSGAPLEPVTGQVTGVDNSVADPSLADPSILDDDKINAFGYQQADADGHFVPRGAHIRKTNPRDETPPGEAESNRHRIIRRGLPYGPELSPSEPAYGGAMVPDAQDRGLLFMCYQSSLERGFEFIQAQWANKPDFPQPGDGRDAIISQDLAAAEVAIPPANLHLQLARWVITTGGEYFFSPSMTALQVLSADPASPPAT